MPKASLSSLPVPGAIFAIAKPSGPTCMAMLDSLKPLLNTSRLFNDERSIREVSKAAKRRKYKRQPGGVKIGQGGTLDPLADGVLVVGVGRGTKKLQEHLDGPKTYRTTGLLGGETDTYDAQGKLVRRAPWKHVTREKIESVLDRFRGEITQLPPIYSALKMDGKPLYEYAREGKKLPRPIEPRKVTVYSLECVGWENGAPSEGEGSGHHYDLPATSISDQDKQTMDQLRKLIVEEGQVEGAAGETEAEAAALPETEEEGRPPVFQLELKVSGGTYVRTLVHDIAHAVGSAAHVVRLSRTQQGQFHCEPQPGDPGNCVAWSVLEEAIEKPRELGEPAGSSKPGVWEKWEEAILEKMEVIEVDYNNA